MIEFIMHCPVSVRAEHRICHAQLMQLCNDGFDNVATALMILRREFIFHWSKGSAFNILGIFNWLLIELKLCLLLFIFYSLYFQEKKARTEIIYFNYFAYKCVDLKFDQGHNVLSVVKTNASWFVMVSVAQCIALLLLKTHYLGPWLMAGRFMGFPRFDVDMIFPPLNSEP